MYLRLKTFDMLHVLSLFGQTGAELCQNASVRGLKKKQLNDIPVENKRELNKSHKNVCARVMFIMQMLGIFLIWLL